MPAEDTVRLRRGSAAAWAALNPVLQYGEPGFAIDTNEIRVGNGTDPWLLLQPMGAKSYTDTKIAGAMGVVFHGAVASTARPTGYGQVFWIGSVTPANAAPNDVWQYQP